MSIQHLSFKGNKYILTDFNNQLSFRQYQIAKKSIKELIPYIESQELGLEFLMDIDLPALGAIIFLEEYETTFSQVTYERRLIEFQDMPLTEETMEILAGAVLDFFTTCMQSLTAGFLSYSNRKSLAAKPTMTD